MTDVILKNHSISMAIYHINSIDTIVKFYTFSVSENNDLPLLDAKACLIHLVFFSQNRPFSENSKQNSFSSHGTNSFCFFSGDSILDS